MLAIENENLLSGSDEHSAFNRPGLGSAVNGGSIVNAHGGGVSNSASAYCIGFGEALSHEISTSIDLMQAQDRALGKKHFNAIIYGPGCKEPMVVKMSREVAKRDINSIN